MAPPVFKTGLAANTVAGGFDSLPPPPSILKPREKGVAIAGVPRWLTIRFRKKMAPKNYLAFSEAAAFSR